MKFDYTMEPGRKLNNRYNSIDESPLISIITPFFNSGKYFEQTYNSVMNQTFPYFEWIIVNDGSTNESDIDFIKNLSTMDNRVRIVNKENGGAAEARNFGVSKSTSELIVFLDADDLIDEKYIEYVYFTLYTNPDAAWVYTDSLGFYESEYLWQREFSSKTMKKENLLSYIGGIRKHIFLEVGGYDAENRNLWEDWQFWLKLLSKNYYPAHIKQALFWYRRLSSGALAAIEKDKKAKSQLLRKIKVLAEVVPNDIKALTFDGRNGESFAPQRKWKWNRELAFKKDKIRILLLIPHMEMGGADKFNLDIISTINKDLFEVGIITTVPAHSEWRQAFTKQVSDVFELPCFLKMNEWSAFIHYYIKSRNVDIVMNISSYYGYYALPWIRKEFPEIGILDCVHAEGKYWRSGGYPRTSVAVDSVIEKTFVTNEFTRQIMIKNYGKEDHKIETIYTGVDEDYFKKEQVSNNELKKKYGISDDRPIVLFLCRIAAEKRPFLMVEIAKETKKRIKNICFLTVGDGPQMEELRRCIQKNKIDETIYLTGRQEDIRPFYAISDISLICSLKEGLAITTFESMLMETPIVSANVGGQKELIDDLTGRLIPCFQDEEKDFDKRVFDKEEINLYVDAICDLLENKEKHVQMGQYCREKVINGFTLRQMINRLENEFMQIKSGRGIEKRILISEALSTLGNLSSDYLTIYNEYESVQIEFRSAYKFSQFVKEILSFKRNPFSILREIASRRDHPIVKQMIKKAKLSWLINLLSRKR